MRQVSAKSEKVERNGRGPMLTILKSLLIYGFDSKTQVYLHSTEELMNKTLMQS